MNVLIVGKNSYIGQCVGKWFSGKENSPAVDYISVRDDAWREKDLSIYEVVLFAAAIVHRKDINDWALYRQVNALLPYEFALQAKKQGVKHFIFLSTMGVYKGGKGLPESTIVNPQTPLSPDGMYGKSKLEAETLLNELADAHFHVSIIRPSNVYGHGCPGNYIPLFTKLTKMLPVLPHAFDNVKQGMVYVDNLAELCWLAANSDRSGIYMAQDAQPVSAYEIMCAITSALRQRKGSIKCTWLFSPLCRISLVNKLFGGIAYSQELAKCPLGDYQIVDFSEGMQRTIQGQS